MSCTSTFESFSAQLREFIRLSPNRGRTPTSSPPGEKGQIAKFGLLATELFALQYRFNPAYRQLCQTRGVEPENLLDWRRIPPVPTSAFKDLEFSCIPQQSRAVTFHSSGTTTERPSRHFHCAQSLALYETSLWPWFARHLLPEGLHAASSAGLIMLTPPPEQAPHSSLVYMCDTIRRQLGGRIGEFFAGVSEEGAWCLHTQRVFAALERCWEERRPALILGTAFSLVQLLDFLANADVRLVLPTGSRVMETGGYKGRSRELPKAQLYSLLWERLGIPPCAIVSEYGMSELSSQAYDQVAGSPEPSPPKRRFHFPPWARAHVVSPETGTEVEEGETGLLRVFDLANAYSVMAVQTEDLAIRHGDGFELRGRAVEAELRGCSLLAS